VVYVVDDEDGVRRARVVCSDQFPCCTPSGTAPRAAGLQRRPAYGEARGWQPPDLQGLPETNRREGVPLPRRPCVASYQVLRKGPSDDHA
jgi:hypothetical protein